MKPRRTPSGTRRLQILDRPHGDPYRADAKLADPSVCSDCGALHRKGRWHWEVAPPGATAVLCPACRRIREHLPAGTVHLEGPFYAGHRDEVIAAIRHVETRAKAEHPMQRIIELDAGERAAMITTTDAHLARGIGDALYAAYKGTLRYRYPKDEATLDVHWIR